MALFCRTPETMRTPVRWYLSRAFVYDTEVEPKVTYVSNIRLERKKGPLRVAQLPGEANPVIFSVHDEIARHYGVDEKTLQESHAATIDYVVAAAGG
jgi:hypothetical protein